MKKKNLISSILFVVFCAFSVFSQDKKENLNFTGTWLWKANKNDFHQIEIEQNGVEIKLKEIIKREKQSQTKRETIYFTDKRGEKNQFYEDKTTESITYLKGNKIIVEFFSNNPKSNKKVKTSFFELEVKNKKLILRQSNTVLTLISNALGHPPIMVRTFRKVE